MIAATSLVCLAAALFLFLQVGASGRIANFVAMAIVGAFLFGPDALISAAAAAGRRRPLAAAQAAGIINGLGSIGGVLQETVTRGVSKAFGWNALFYVFVALALLSAVGLSPTFQGKGRGRRRGRRRRRTSAGLMSRLGAVRPPGAQDGAGAAPPRSHHGQPAHSRPPRRGPQGGARPRLAPRGGGAGSGSPGREAVGRARPARAVRGHVERVLTHLLGAHTDLDDLAQEVFLRALQRVDDLREPSALREWLAGFAANVAREAIRKKRRRWWQILRPAEETPEIEAPSSTPEDRAAVRAFYEVLDHLDADARIAFTLRYVEAMELTQVARVCGVSLATIKRRIKAAEGEFCARGRAHEALASWFEEGTRWR